MIFEFSVICGNFFQSFVDLFFSHLWIYFPVICGFIFQSFVDFYNNHLVFNHIKKIQLVDSNNKNKTTPCIILNHNYETNLMRIGNICGLRFRQLYPQKNCPEIPSSSSYKALIVILL